MLTGSILHTIVTLRSLESVHRLSYFYGQSGPFPCMLFPRKFDA